MKRHATHIYRCPYTLKALEIKVDSQDSENIVKGQLISPQGNYVIEDGIPHLINFELESLNEVEQKEYQHYQTTSEDYDQVIKWIFKSFYADENKERNKMIDLLDLQPNHRVLETGCGTCEDSIYIAKRLNHEGELYMQDLSVNMLKIGKEKMLAATNLTCPMEFFVSNASTLPFPDNYFDSAYHFGGINLFTDRKKAISEMARVVRPGGKVVFGDESMAPWLRNTTFGQILMNSNKLFQYETPIDCLPESARNVNLNWLLGNAYYLITFEVGEGAPEVDLDLPILGKRGGTHRSRYYGALENVSLETKQKVLKAIERSGMSAHEWLDKVVSEAAEA